MCSKKKPAVKEKISGQRKSVVKSVVKEKMCGQRKNVWSKKISGQRKMCGQRKSVVKENVWSKKMCGQTCGQKISALKICALWRYPKCGQAEKKNVVKTRRYLKTCGQRKSLITCHTKRV